MIFTHCFSKSEGIKLSENKNLFLTSMLTEKTVFFSKDISGSCVLELLTTKVFKVEDLVLNMALNSFQRMNIHTMNFKLVIMTYTSKKLELSVTPLQSISNMQTYESRIS